MRAAGRPLCTNETQHTHPSHAQNPIPPHNNNNNTKSHQIKTNQQPTTNNQPTNNKQNPKVTADRAFNGHGTNFEGSPEPIYGTQFLPRKFKVAVTVPGDNSVDIYTNDLGVVVITDANGELQGFNILAGGGMGRSHRNNDTFPRLADEIGYVDKEDVYHAVKAIVATQVRAGGGAFE